jgi:hypothetical protein
MIRTEDFTADAEERRGGYPRPWEEKTRAMRALASSWIFRRWSAPRKLSAYSL